MPSKRKSFWTSGIVGISSVCVQRRSAFNARVVVVHAILRIWWRQLGWLGNPDVGRSIQERRIAQTLQYDVALFVRDTQLEQASLRPQSATTAMGPLVAARPVVATGQASSLVRDASGPPACLPGSQAATVQTIASRLPAATEVNPSSRGCYRNSADWAP